MRSLRLVTRESVRLSRNRDDTLLALLARKRATLHELARATSIPAPRVRAVLYGDLPDYSVERALIPLGVVRSVRTRFGVQFELTQRGTFESCAIRDARGAGRLL
jgi:hypothetical protein